MILSLDAKITFPIFGDGFVLDPPTHFTILGFNIYFYAVIIASGFILAVLYILKRRSEFGLTQDNVLDMFILVVPSGIVGARLYYVLFNPEGFFGAGNWLNIFNIRQGGLAIYGGVIAAVIAIFIYSRKKKIPTGVFFDVGALGLLIGQTLGRWGNFFNREAFGYPTDLPWKMGLITEANTYYVHPTFLYESLWNLIGFLWIHRFSKKHRKYDGEIFLLYLAWYGFGRFIIEGLRTDSLYLLQTDIRISQLIAALSFGIALYFLVRNRMRIKISPSSLFANTARINEKSSSDVPEKSDKSKDITSEQESNEKTAQADTENKSDTNN